MIVASRIFSAVSSRREIPVIVLSSISSQGGIAAARLWKRNCSHTTQRCEIAALAETCLIGPRNRGGAEWESIIGDGLRARSLAGQGSEAVLGCAILNRMAALG